MAFSTSRSLRSRIIARRRRLRRQGLQPVEIWVPDARAPEFRVEAHRQSLAVARSAYEGDDQAFIDAASEDDE